MDAHFLNETDEQRYVAMKDFQGQLRVANTLTNAEGDYSSQIGMVQEVLAAKEAELAETKKQLDALQQRIDTAKIELETLKEESGLPCSVFPQLFSCPEPLKEALENAFQLEDRKEQAISLYAIALKEIEDNQETLECLTKKSQGKNCGLFDRFSNAPDIKSLQAKLSSLDNRVGDFAENTINLLTSFLFKSLAIPLLFFYILLKIANLNWGKLE